MGGYKLLTDKHGGMSLVLPSEVIVDTVLPTLRVMLAHRLADHDLTQQEIATHLGVTQAAVSSYLREETIPEPRIQNHPRTAETLDRIAAGLATGDLDEYDALADLLSLITHFEDRGPICELHEEAMPALHGLGCDLCIRGTDTELHAERAVLTDVRKAARILATTPTMAAYIPNVGTNIGAALPDPSGITDIAAIPGRIYEMGGRVEVPSDPEFGASRHVATAILAANAQDPAMKGAVNLATDETLLTSARDAGLEPLEFDPDYEDRGEHLRDRFREHGSVPRVCFHRGAFGIEPITYLFGETAVDAAELAADLLHRLD